MCILNSPQFLEQIVLRLFKSMDSGSSRGDEPVARRGGPANASDVTKQTVPSGDVHRLPFFTPMG